MQPDWISLQKDTSGTPSGSMWKVKEERFSSSSSYIEASEAQGLNLAFSVGMSENGRSLK